MFRAPCMSQRRLALIFCVSVLIVLLVALILLCEWGPSPGLPGGRPCWGWGSVEAGETHRPGGERAETGSSFFLSVPDIWWTHRSEIAGKGEPWAPCGPGWGAARHLPSPGPAWVGGGAPSAAPRLALPGACGEQAGPVKPSAVRRRNRHGNRGDGFNPHSIQPPVLQPLQRVVLKRLGG